MVLQFYSSCCVMDSFRFASMIQLPCCVKTGFLVSFGLSSLFTKITLNETISICADYLNRIYSRPPPYPEHLFIELMKLVTKSV